MKKIFSILLSAVIITATMLTASPALQTSAAATKSQADAATNFTFNGSMSKEVLRSYVSRAVSHLGFCGAVSENPIFEEDLRFLLRIGAKYIGRATSISWNGNLTEEQLENHYKIAEEAAKKAHAADPEMILQAGIFEIAYKGTVNNTKIPAHVFEAFGQPVEDRNFRWEDVVYPAGSRDKDGNDIGIGCWGGRQDAGFPDIKQLETKMYFYYQICRYIDAGYEAFHMGQAEKMMQYIANYANHWDELLTKARAYAKTHARRGVALFDCHTAISSGGIMVGNRHVFDIVAAGMCPNETVEEDGAMKCELKHYAEGNWLSWVGRSAGGQHPLGFEIEENFTIIEFDNYGISSEEQQGKATYRGFMNWGFDDVTWYALQPEEYRNQFLLECADYLSNNELCLDSQGKQQYFLQPVTFRCITTSNKYCPTMTYVPGEHANVDFIFDYLRVDGTDIEIDGENFNLTVKGNYHANNQSDGCPNGFNQEDTIREIFLGKNEPEDPELLKVVLPSKYAAEEEYVTEALDPTSSKATANTSSRKNNTTANNTTTGSTANTASVTSTESEAASSEELTTESEETTSTVVSSDTTTGTDKPKGSALPWIIVGIVAAVVVLAGGGVLLYFLVIKKK